MDERQPPPLRNSSRTLAIAAVAVLVVIAIAGIVLAGLRGRGAPAGTPAAADATQPAASAMTAAADASAVKAEAEAGPNQVVFAPESDQLSDPATTKLIRFAEAAHKDKRTVIIASKVEVRPERPQEMELARKRANAVRGVLEAHGLPLGTMQIQIAEVPLGLVPPSEANRVDLALR
jgi:outer membrane protein OmpA-like peptidoglycan-associated protein